MTLRKVLIPGCSNTFVKNKIIHFMRITNRKVPKFHVLAYFMLQDFFEDMKKLIKKKDKAAIKRNYQSMYERMLNYSKPETQSARGGKSKTTQESGKAF